MNLLKKHITIIVAIFTFMIGGMVLFGYFLDIDLIKGGLPSSIPMKFNTALCFFLLGVSLFFYANDSYKAVVNSLYIFVSLVGFFTLVQYLFGIDLQIDELLWQNVKNSIETSGSSRMSLNAAFGFFVLGLSLLFIKNQKLHIYIKISLFVGMLMSLVGLFNYLLGYGLSRIIPSFLQIDLATTFVLIMLYISVFYSPYLSHVRFSFEQKLNIGFIFTIFTLFGLFYMYGENRNDFTKTKELINHTREIISQVESILIEVIDVETGARGYVITGNPVFLESYSSSVAPISRYLSELDKATEYSQLQNSRADSLRKLVVQKIDLNRELIDLRKNKGFEEAKELIANARGKILMDSIRLMAEVIRKTEISRLDNQKQSGDIYEKNLNRVVIFFQMMSALILISLFVIIIKNLKKRKEVELQLWKSNNRFLTIFKSSPTAMIIADAKTDEIMYVNDSYCKITEYEREGLLRKKAKDIGIISEEELTRFYQEIERHGGQIRDYETRIYKGDGQPIDILLSVETLEIDNKLSYVCALVDISKRKIAEEQLKAVNKELDSFSYSVSHDLRAPLRAISGYAKILLEDYSDKMDGEGRRVMDVIVKNASKMGQLIDDLLAFSRLGKQNLVKVTVDMNFLVNSIANGLIEHESDKNIEIDIKNLNSAMGDSNMIKVVMDNLLSNALKYSSKKEKIKIEVGSYQEDKSNVYYVKDNGVGFDMLYYDKLFGVFQRLHSMAEFEGTGVGLAIVQRIVTRHGGKVWAEAEIDKGATFYFSLPIK